MKTSMCSGWEFTPAWSDAFAAFEAPGEPVRLPHNPVEIPQHYADHQAYQLLCGYRRILNLPDIQEKRFFLKFDGAGHIATLLVNGREVYTHGCGYTSFAPEITEYVKQGENKIAVRLDTTENPTVPPFGFVIDYLTYGGLYREAWLIEKPKSYIKDVTVITPKVDSFTVTVDAPGYKGEYGFALETLEGETVWHTTSKKAVVKAENLPVRPWNTTSPCRYRCVVTLSESGDREEVVFGFRTVKFKADGFYLNGEKTFLRGLNRHQCYPYIGYAAPQSLQREDARILKEELHCNAVRTSHYPQSQYFIDECDRLGLLVFTEIPGWQHIGDEQWKDQACRNTEEMVRQYRNHPSVILWGVRINESQDDPAFYKRTNKIAHDLDPSRQTSGVRYLVKSDLKEDVYAFNDFSHEGNNPGVRSKKKVTPDARRGFLISEHNGHMFPTKSYDPWAKRQEQALRHMRVLNDAYASGEHAGCFGWCMFDYPTHREFGSGDRVCYHGVMDAFRNPKLAAFAYASQGEGAWVLEVGSNMDIGDYPAGNVGDVYVFSNAEEVVLYKNDIPVTKLRRWDGDALPHPLFVLDDTIGDMLETQEKFPEKKAKDLKECLRAAAKYGVNNLPAKYKAKMALCMVKYHMKFADGAALFGKYVSGWGDSSTVWRLDALSGGRVVKSVTKAPDSRLHLEVSASSRWLRETDSYDMAAVRIRLADGLGNPAPYAQLPVKLRVEGPLELVGPDVVTAEGGMTGCYLKTTGETGTAVLTVETAQTEPLSISFQIKE